MESHSLWFTVALLAALLAGLCNCGAIETADQILKRVKADNDKSLQNDLKNLERTLRKQNLPEAQQLANEMDRVEVLLVKSGDSSRDCSGQRIEALLSALDEFGSRNERLLELINLRALSTFAECRPLWNEQLIELTRSELREQVREKAGWLLDSLVAVAQKSSPKRGDSFSRPYSRRLLERVAGSHCTGCMPPSAGIILLLSRFVGLDLDENMKNHQLSKQDYEQFTRNILRLTCNPIHSKLTPFINSRYTPFRPSEDGNKTLLRYNVLLAVWLMTGLESDVDEANEWLALQQICSKLAPEPPQTYLDSIYREITDQPESAELFAHMPASSSPDAKEQYMQKLVEAHLRLDKQFEAARREDFCKQNGFKP